MAKYFLSKQQRKLLNVIREQLGSHNPNSTIKLTHSNPHIQHVEHRIGWVLDKVEDILHQDYYTNDNIDTLNDLRELFYTKIKGKLSKPKPINIEWV